MEEPSLMPGPFLVTGPMSFLGEVSGQGKGIQWVRITYTVPTPITTLYAFELIF